jgi:hypothetical protein
MRAAFVRILIVAIAALGLAGCASEHRVTGPLPARPTAPPSPDSPANAIRRFEWGWNNREPESFRQLLAGDFRFVFALGDSAGNAFRDDPIGREEMLVCLQHLFVTGGVAPRATSIVLTLDPALVPLPDSRPGRDPKWHKEILTSVDLTIRTEDLDEFRVTGNARFFVVRGDSAVIPAELAAEGAGPDSTRWYLQEWRDETLTAGGTTLRTSPALPQGGHNTTWGDILALYSLVPGAARR